MQTKALVTGGAGFIGSNVVRLLLSKGWKVRVIDNLSSGYEINLDGLDVDFIEGDVRDAEVTREACKNGRIMNILVTGASGFVGKNLCASLRSIRDGKDQTTGIDSDLEILEFDVDSDPELLDLYCSKANFVFNLAGVNRPEDPAEFLTGNFGFASTLLDTLKKHGNTCPVMLSSSTQAERDNPYGLSKKAGEDLFFEYAKETGAQVLVYRFPNVFGKWCRPNYNSAVATFCHNIARDLPITVNDPNMMMTLVYIDDVVAELIRALKDEEHLADPFCEVPVVHRIELGRIADLLYSFRASRGGAIGPHAI